MDPRYVVMPWELGNSTMFCVWDNHTNQRQHGCPLWHTYRFAQEDADKLNGMVVKMDA